MFLPFAQPLDLPSTLESGQAFRWALEDSWYTGVVFGNVVRLRRLPGGVEFFSAPDGAVTLEPLLRDYLRLEDDLEAIYRAIDLDEHIGAAIARYRGMRLVRQDPWECLVSFICSANSNIRRIARNIDDIARSFGRPVLAGGPAGGVRHAFPSPGDLAEAGARRLRELGLGFRAEYVAGTARVIADGDLDLFALREASYEEALEALTSLPGVGDKVANCVLLFSLDKLEAFPVDVWVHRAVEEWYPDAPRSKTARRGVRRWAQEYFGPYAGYANQYLFQYRRLRGKA